MGSMCKQTQERGNSRGLERLLLAVKEPAPQREDEAGTDEDNPGKPMTDPPTGYGSEETTQDNGLRDPMSTSQRKPSPTNERSAIEDAFQENRDHQLDPAQTKSR